MRWNCRRERRMATSKITIFVLNLIVLSPFPSPTNIDVSIAKKFVKKINLRGSVPQKDTSLPIPPPFPKRKRNKIVRFSLSIKKEMLPFGHLFSLSF
jgi:hypothetical protein